MEICSTLWASKHCILIEIHSPFSALHTNKDAPWRWKPGDGLLFPSFPLSVHYIMRPRCFIWEKEWRSVHWFTSSRVSRSDSGASLSLYSSIISRFTHRQRCRFAYEIHMTAIVLTVSAPRTATRVTSAAFIHRAGRVASIKPSGVYLDRSRSRVMMMMMMIVSGCVYQLSHTPTSAPPLCRTPATPPETPTALRMRVVYVTSQSGHV